MGGGGWQRVRNLIRHKGDQGAGQTDLAWFLLKLSFTKNCTDGSRRRLRGLKFSHSKNLHQWGRGKNRHEWLTLGRVLCVPRVVWILAMVQEKVLLPSFYSKKDAGSESRTV